MRCRALQRGAVKLEFHDADTDTGILARILVDTSDTRDFLKLFLWQAERHADILATILARMSVSVTVSVSWKASLTQRNTSAVNREKMSGARDHHTLVVCMFIGLSVALDEYLYFIRTACFSHD